MKGIFIGFFLYDKLVSGATIMSALLITGLKVRLELVLTPQANDINLVLGPVVARSPKFY